MKHLFVISLALFLIAGCTPQAGMEDDETAKQNVEVVKKMLLAYEDENIDAIKEAYSPNCVSIGPMHDMIDTTLSWMEGNAEWFETIDSFKVDIIKLLPYTVEEGDLAGDWVLAWADLSWYVIKSDKSVMVLWHSPMRLEDGKIVYEVSYWNQWDVFKQLGAELEWPEKEGMEEEDD